MTIATVSELTAQIKAMLEATFEIVRVQGEVGRVTYHASGHCYFSLKDSGATIDAVMFRGNVTKLKFRLETGMQVVLEGAITLFAPQGRYQINCVSVEPAGAGALAFAYEQLKKKLNALGWFSPDRKKPLPKYPQRVALVTSATGAALQDMLRVAKKRWTLTRLVCINTIVQGEAAAASIVRSIGAADALGVDVVVLARGGGSMEDLWCFNDESVARAVFECQTPIISAIGHEIDTVITDFIADKRAPTPSAAIELLLPDMNDERMRLDEIASRLADRAFANLDQMAGYLAHLRTMLTAYSPAARFSRAAEQNGVLLERLGQAYEFVLRTKSAELAALRDRFILLDPAAKLPPKLAQIVRGNAAITVKELAIGDTFELIDKEAIVQAQTIGKWRKLG